MGYVFNSSVFASAFTVPSAVVDKYIRLSGAVQIKVLLYLLRHIADGVDIPAAAAALGIPEGDAADAVKYWCDLGLLVKQGEPAADVKTTEKKADSAPAIRPRAQKPTREEVARRGNEDEEIAFLLREAELKFGRTLKANEASTLVWLHDDEGLPTAVILLLLELAVSEKSCNVGFIERTAIGWINRGVSDIRSAEAEIREMQERYFAWRIVERAMGISRRMPSTNELKAADMWVNKWKFGEDVLRAAYEVCVDNTSKFSMPYVKSVLESWHKNGVKTAADIAKIPNGKKEKRGSDMAAYDLDLVEQMLRTGGND